jgi:exopolysaccharide/PEP-CTERM locus tyrosine autokinase
MSSLIEQAAERLEQLRLAGVVPPTNGRQPASQAELATAAPPNITSERPISPPSAAVHVAIEPSRDADIAMAAKMQRVDFDLNALATANLVTPDATRSQVADEFRVVKRPLINNVKAANGSTPTRNNLIMVTSAVAGEGKSFTAVNLAMSIAAELDHTVMLVDADLARPSLPRMLGVADGPGLLDLLDGTAEMSDVLLRTNVDKLTLLRSGTPHAKATELLASEAMRRLVDEMSKRYQNRIIVFDSPPLLLTTEARALAMYMGQIVFVVRAGKTLQSAVEHALATIEACPTKMLLLNQIRPEKHGIHGEYGLGYGYGYGYGYGRGPTRRGA